MTLPTHFVGAILICDCCLFEVWGDDEMLFRWFHWVVTHFFYTHTQTPVFIHTANGSLKVSDAEMSGSVLATPWSPWAPFCVLLSSSSRRRTSPNASHVSHYGISAMEDNNEWDWWCFCLCRRWNTSVFTSDISNDVLVCLTLCCTPWRHGCGVPLVWVLLCALTPALIKLVQTCLCLGFRAQILYSMTRRIQTHITHTNSHWGSVRCCSAWQSGFYCSSQ